MNATLISANQGFGNQQGYNDFYWNGPTNYTQEPYPSSSSFSFTGSYDAGFYQDPSPPIPMSSERCLFEQLLESQHQFAVNFTDKIDAMTSDLYGKFEAVYNHVQKLQAQNSQDAETVQKRVESAACRSVCRSTPSICVDRQASGKQTESRSQPSNDLSSSAIHVDRHTPDPVDRHDPRADLPYVVIPPSVKSNDYAPKVPYPRPRRSKEEIEDARCNAMMAKIKGELPENESHEISPPIKRVVKRMVLNDLTPEEGALLTRDISAIFLSSAPKKKKAKKETVIVSKKVGIPAFSLEISDDITAGYVNKLRPSERPSKLEDWSGNHLFSTRLSEEVQIRDCDDVFIMETMIAELSCRKHSDIEITESLSIDTNTCVERHHRRAEPDASNRAVSGDVLNVGIPGYVPQEKAPHLPLSTPRKKLRYASSNPPLPKFINKTFRTSKPALRLTKPQDSRRGLVSSFDECVGKRSIPPILQSHPSAVLPQFLGRPHALNAYTPPWMRRRLSQKYLLPPSDPPDL